MKNVYYKRLIADRQDLSASERIVYSFLIYSCINECEYAWDKETGKFDSIELDNIDYFDLPSYLFNDKGILSCTYISNLTSVSKATVCRAIENFKQRQIIFDKYIVNEKIYSNGYFELKTESDLNGELLIFYSFLQNMKDEKGLIYANRKKLALLYGVEMEDIRDYLRRLKKPGFVKRDENGNLILK